jgi:hypothetical protein
MGCHQRVKTDPVRVSVRSLLTANQQSLQNAKAVSKFVAAFVVSKALDLSPVCVKL